MAYLNEEIILAALVDWAEDAVGLEDVGPDEDVDLLMDILMYLAAADSPAFPLGWDVSVEFLRRLGVCGEGQGGVGFASAGTINVFDDWLERCGHAV